ncbi:MAG TPA: hypothetical protein VKX17_25920, partial [Planctomycetota bacterium]|nr:hypothetical protein [Planctomycetota bacterium]
RIRAAQYWPYDYSREVESPLLWVSEGFTTYYGSVLLYRAGLNTRAEFYDSCAGMIAQCESSPVREYVSPAESSVSTWLGYDNHGVFELSYYFTGRNLATLLDLSILHDTGGKKALDDVMRALYTDCYLNAKGFDRSDLLAALQKVSGHDYNDFFKRYAEGVERPPYEEMFAYAGLKIEFTKQRDAGGNFHAKIVEIPDATDAQKKIREAWLRQTSRIEK